MKARLYVRIAKNGSRVKVQASTRPSFEPLERSNYGHEAIPTVQFALDVDIPDKEFDAARIRLEAKIKETTPCVSIKQVEETL